jgi:hypothetical protein
LTTSCDQCREQLAEYALGTADAAQRELVATHLATCPACRQEFKELQAAWSLVPLSLQPVEPSLDLFDRVLARIDGNRPDAAASANYQPSRRERILSYAVAAAVLIGLTVGFWRIANPAPDGAADRRSAEKLAERLGNLQEMERLLAAENVRVVALTQDSSPGALEAYIIWDLAAGQWHFYASNLPAPPAGRTYQLWIVDKSGKHFPGPSFAPNDEGIGSALVDVPELDVRSVAKAVVTLEAADGASKPTGKIYLEAAL